jgi:symplekin
VLVRFLSEIPEVTIAITQRVASLAKDPERVNLTVQALMWVFNLVPLPDLHFSDPVYLGTWSCSDLQHEKCASTLWKTSIRLVSYPTQPLNFPTQHQLLTKNLPDEESRPAAGKVLARWRPQALPAPAETAQASSTVAAPAPAAPQAEVQAPTASTWSPNVSVIIQSPYYYRVAHKGGYEYTCFSQDWLSFLLFSCLVDDILSLVTYLISYPLAISFKLRIDG